MGCCIYPMLGWFGTREALVCQWKGAEQKLFHDYAACAEHLIEQRWTNSNLICGHGMSAGGCWSCSKHVPGFVQGNGYESSVY